MTEEAIPSFNEQLRRLNRGESLARSKRYEMGAPEAASLNEQLHGMRRTVNSAVSRIREATGSNFRVDSGTLITSDNEAVLAVVSVTRL
jgi:hypothetical protein